MTAASNPATGERCARCGGYFLANDQRNEINDRVLHDWCLFDASMTKAGYTSDGLEDG